MLKTTENGTFLVRILDQQHNSWQGIITWLADGETKTFRSLLEFINIVGDAMESCISSDYHPTDYPVEEVSSEPSHRFQRSKSAASSQVGKNKRQSSLKLLDQTG